MGTQNRPYAKFYKEDNAELVRMDDIPGTNTRTITRLWRCSLPEDQEQDVVAEMDLYTSSSNANPQKWVNFPSVGKTGEIDPKMDARGIWRLQWNAYNPIREPPLGIYQQLSKNYLQPPKVSNDLAAWALLDAEARITKVLDFTATAKAAIKPYFIVTYPNVAQETVQGFVDAIVPRGVLTNPTFDGQTTLTGTYKFAAAKNEEQDDGSSIVMAVLVDATDPGGLAVLFANNCGSMITRTIYMGVSVPPTVPTGSSGVEYFIRDFSFDTTLGMYSLAIEQVSQNTLTAGVFESSETDIEKNEAQDFLGVRNWDSGTNSGVDQNGGSVPVWTPGNPTPGVEQTQEITKNQNCTVDVRQKKQTVKALSHLKDRSTATAFQTVALETDKAQSATLGTAPAAAAGVVKTYESTKNGLQQFDNDTTIITEIAYTAATLAKQKTVFETRTEQLDRSQALVTDLTPSASSGTIINKTGDVTDGNLLNVKTETIVETPVTAAVVENQSTVFDTHSRQVDKAQALATSVVSTATGGVITNKTGQDTPGGLKDVTTEVITEIPVTGAIVDKQTTVFETKTRQVDKAQALATDLTPSVSAGTIVNKAGQETPGGLKDITTETIVELPVTAAVVENQATIFQTVARQTDKAQPSATSVVATATGGVITNKTGQETPGGLKDVITDVITEVSVPSATVVKRLTAFDLTTETANQNQSGTASDPSVPGQTVENTKTPGGIYNQRITAITPTTVTDANHQSSATIFDITAVTTDRNATIAATPVTAVPSAGVLHVVESQETELGKFNNTTTTKTEQDVANAVVLNVVTALQTESQITEKGASASTDLTATGGGGAPLVQKQGVLTPGGKKDVTVTVKTPIAVGVTLTFPNRTGAETRWYFKNQTQAAVEAKLAALTNGTYNDLVSWGGLNEFGLLDGHIASRAQVGGFSGTGIGYDVQGIVEHSGRTEVVDGMRYWIDRAYTYNFAVGNGIQYGQAAFAGGGQGSEFHFNKNADTWDLQRVTSIVETWYTYGTGSGSGWTPGALVASGSPVTVFTATPVPYGNS